MDLSKKLKNLRLDHGLTQSELAAQLSKGDYSITISSVANWEIGRKRLTDDDIIAICNYFDISDIREFLTGEQGPTVADLTMFNEMGQKHIYEYLRLLGRNPLFTDDNIQPPVRNMIRVYDLPVSAGTGSYLHNSDYEEVSIDADIPRGTDYALRVQGSSMEPKYYEGQLLFIKEAPAVEIGEIGIFILNDEAYVKKLGKRSLISLNPKYPPIKLGEFDEMKTVGRVLGAY